MEPNTNNHTGNFDSFNNIMPFQILELSRKESKPKLPTQHSLSHNISPDESEKILELHLYCTIYTHGNTSFITES